MSCALRITAVCDDARTSPDGKLDLHGVYHDLSAPGFPAKQDHLVLVLVIEWGRKDHGRFQFKADLEDSEGNISMTVEGESEVRAVSEDHPPQIIPILCFLNISIYELDINFARFEVFPAP